MVKAGSAFYVMTINPLAGPTAGTPYKVIAYFPDYDGGLSQLSLPYREKIVSHQLLFMLDSISEVAEDI